MLKDQGLGLTLRNEDTKHIPERLKPHDPTGQIRLYPIKRMGMATTLTIMATISRLTNKVKETLKSVNKLGLLALALVALATMAFTSSKNLTSKRWAFNPSAPIGSQYTDITSLTEQTPEHIGQYRCNDGEEVCTAEYDALDNPNSGSPTPISVKYGDFEFLDQQK